MMNDEYSISNLVENTDEQWIKEHTLQKAAVFRGKWVSESRTTENFIIPNKKK